jgi:hypothetical protein
MTPTRAVAACLASLVVLAGCTAGDEDGPAPEPDLSTIREAAWTVTAEEIAGAKGATMSTIGGFQSVDSAASGGLVISAADSTKKLTLAGIDAKSGEIAWRRALALQEDFGAYCQDDDGGPNVVCSVHDFEAKTQELVVVDDRSGTIRQRVELEAEESFAVSGDQLYLTTFRPKENDGRLDVDIERRSMSTGRSAWLQETSFAIEGWGHDGAQGLDIGAQRVAAYSASWEVVVDRRTGRLLNRVDDGRFEQSLGGGGWLVTDSGDGTENEATATLFDPSGQPVAEDRTSAFLWPDHDDHRLVSIGRHLREQATGRSLFEAPRGQQILMFTDGGRSIVTEPAGSAHGEDEELSFQVWSANPAKRRGTVNVQADELSDSIGSGAGVLLVTTRYDEDADKPVPSSLHVVDAGKGSLVATIDLGWTVDIFDRPTAIRTRAGAAVTGGGGVKGFVPRP